MVGTLEPRKGHAVALEACSRLWQAGEDFELVIVGKAGWNIEQFIAQMRTHPEFGVRLHWQPDVEFAIEEETP